MHREKTFQIMKRQIIMDPTPKSHKHDRYEMITKDYENLKEIEIIYVPFYY